MIVIIIIIIIIIIITIITIIIIISLLYKNKNTLRFSVCLSACLSVTRSSQLRFFTIHIY